MSERRVPADPPGGVQEHGAEPERLRRLRSQAMAALSRGEVAIDGLAADARAEVGTLLEELRVYQAELEIQNQEVSAANQRTEREHARVTHLLRTMPIPALLVDAHGLVTASNALASALLRLPGGALRAHSVFRLLGDRDDPTLARLLDRARTAGVERTRADVRLRTVQSDAHPFLVHASAMPTVDAEPAEIALLLIDQTRVHELDELRELEAARTQRFVAAERAAGVGTWDWDIAGDTIRWDDAALELVGLPPGTSPFEYAFWRTLVHPEDLDHVEAGYAEQTGRRGRFENISRYRHADGRWIWLRAAGRVTSRDRAGQPIQATGVLIDISELQRLQATLETTNRELTLLGGLVDRLQGLRSMAECGAVLREALGPLFAGAPWRLELLADESDRGVVWESETFGKRPARPAPHGGEESPERSDVRDAGRVRIPLLAEGGRIGDFDLFAGTPAQADRLRPLAHRLCGSLSLGLANLRLRERLEHLSNHDPLTGLYNRRFVADALPRAFGQAAREGTRVAVAMIDIDHFKQVNDRFGHETGDAVLRALARRLGAHRVGSDLAARYGGEEFLLALAGVDAPTALRLLEALRADLAGNRLGEDAELPSVTISIGLAMFPDDGRRTDQVIRAADDALYRAKALGRNRVCVAGSQGGGIIPSL